MRFNSNFGFDPTTKFFTSPAEVWEEYIKVNFINATFNIY